MKNLQIYKYVEAIARTGSIRKAANEFSITPSALNRRLLALEDELEVKIFERIANGMRLNQSGEIIVSLFRSQLSEINNLKSQLADFSGFKRGQISIICSQALLPYFLPTQIDQFQEKFADIKFNINVGDGEKAISYLRDFKSDLALIFEPVRSNYIETISTISQPIQAVMSLNHPLSKFKSINLKDCINYPLALPPSPYAVREILETAASEESLNLKPTVEAESYIFLHNFVARKTNTISFEVEIDVPKQTLNRSISTVPLNLSKSYQGQIHLLKLQGRTFSGATEKFIEQLLEVFNKK